MVAHQKQDRRAERVEVQRPFRTVERSFHAFRRDLIQRLVDCLEPVPPLSSEGATARRLGDMFERAQIDPLLPFRLRIPDSNGMNRDPLLLGDLGCLLRRQLAGGIVSVGQQNENPLLHL